MVQDVHDTVRFVLIQMGLRPFNKANFFENKVDITVRGYVVSAAIDSDNIAAKIYIDPLKYVLIPDDNNKYVGKVCTETIIVEKNPRIEIILKERTKV